MSPLDVHWKNPIEYSQVAPQHVKLQSGHLDQNLWEISEKVHCCISSQKQSRAFKIVLVSEFGGKELGWKEVTKTEAWWIRCVYFFVALVSAGALYARKVCVLHLPGFCLERQEKGLYGLQDWPWESEYGRQHRVVVRASGIKASRVTLGKWCNFPKPQSPQL